VTSARTGRERRRDMVERCWDVIPAGTFFAGDEIEPGTFHSGDEVAPGTFHA